jgi:hypothetical protein
MRIYIELEYTGDTTGKRFIVLADYNGRLEGKMFRPRAYYHNGMIYSAGIGLFYITDFKFIRLRPDITTLDDYVAHLHRN